MKNQIFRRSKKKWPNEADALKDVLDRQQIEASELYSQHDDSHFIWAKKATVFSYSKNEMTERHAIGNAINDSGLMPHELTRQDTKKHYVFRKIQ
jgi:hypothetical protein